MMQWKHVAPGETLPFQFESRGKLRHLNTHDMKIHQIIVRAEGWQETTAVSVDRVGTYFRRVMPEYLVSVSPSADMGVEMPPARIVVDVSLDGSARKLIDVRSALLVENRLLQPVELKLENTALKIGDVKEMALGPGEVRPVPLAYVWSRIFAKPSTGSVGQGRIV